MSEVLEEEMVEFMVLEEKKGALGQSYLKKKEIRNQ